VWRGELKESLRSWLGVEANLGLGFYLTRGITEGLYAN
jgi:hypothetical protein